MHLVWIVVLSVLILSACAEWLHLRRAKGTHLLMFGPNSTAKGSLVILVAALVRVLLLTLLAWALMILLLLPEKNHGRKVGAVESKERRHLLLVLDVSPSMRLRLSLIHISEPTRPY